MRFMRPCWKMLVVSVIVGFSSGTASAQNLPWNIYLDDISASACEVVNAANAELVVLTNTSQLAIVSGEDVILVDTFVDVDGSVFFEGAPAGVVDFAEDDDGLRSLWWMSLTGQAVEIDEFTGVPTPSAFIPGDFGNVPCDACPLWDDQSICLEDPIVLPPISFNICGMNSQLGLGLTGASLAFMGFVRRRR